MFKIRTAVFVATGALAALGVAGTALAADGGFSASASPSASATSSVRGSAAVSVEAAKEIAVRVAGGGFVESVERETEHGRPVFSVDVIVDGVEHDVYVDRANGEVLRHRIKGGADVRVSPSSSATPRTSASSHAEPGDDKGGLRTRGTEAGDDNGGLRTRGTEAGDDNGGSRTRGTEAGDDNGGSRAREAGDDHGGRGRGSDDKGGDDHGRGGHGSDD
ncbi:PepSY domain-containing protein [Actinoplanes sp. HUAS TT8]|uniref:PepSY domain-containing protein n=1 Tax=Actinoplanes sp. HUAS TT8 TaxID=3447453 RepID=UPI003F527384